MSVTIAARREIVAVCRRLYQRGLIAGPDGNVSVRIAPDRILVTPAGLSKVAVQEHELVELTLDGKRVRGSHRASSEVAMHLRAYRRRPDVNAVVHAHPPVATGFAVAGEDFVGNVGRRLHQVQIGLLLEPLLDDLHVQQAQESTAEA